MKIMDKIPLYPTVMTKEEASFIYELSQNTKGKGEIVEIGTNMGISALTIATAQKEKQGKPVYTIDIWEHPDLKKNLKLAGVEKYVKPVLGESSKLSKRWKKDIELLWLDGDHSYYGTASDIKNWTRHVMKGGIVALHDYPGDHASKEVWKAVHKHLLSKPETWKLIADRKVTRIIAFERIDYKSPMKKKGWLYWRYRDFRYLMFKYAPKLSNKIIEMIKK